MTIYTYHYANVSGGLGHHDMHTSRKLKLVTSLIVWFQPAEGKYPELIIDIVTKYSAKLIHKNQKPWIYFWKLNFHAIETIRIYYYHENWKRQIQFPEWKRPKPSAIAGKTVFADI